MFHNFISEDGHVVCLMCGGTWCLTDPASVVLYYGDAVAANGDAPTRCSGDTSMCHGDAYEHGHELAECSRHECNCLFCA